MAQTVELLSVKYAFDETANCIYEIPRGLKLVGINDVGFPLCIDPEQRLVLWDPDRRECCYLAPGVKAFSALVEQTKHIDGSQPVRLYASELRKILSAVDPALLSGGFWDAILEEIDREAKYEDEDSQA